MTWWQITLLVVGVIFVCVFIFYLIRGAIRYNSYKKYVRIIVNNADEYLSNKNFVGCILSATMIGKHNITLCIDENREVTMRMQEENHFAFWSIVPPNKDDLFTPEYYIMREFWKHYNEVKERLNYESN